MSYELFDQSSKAFSSVIRYENLRDILRERLKLSYITLFNIGLVNQISAFLKPVTKLFDKLEGVLTFSISLLGPGSGFIWVTWVRGKQKWPSFISATTSMTVFKNAWSCSPCKNVGILFHFGKKSVNQWQILDFLATYSGKMLPRNSKNTMIC